MVTTTTPRARLSFICIGCRRRVESEQPRETFANFTYCKACANDIRRRRKARRGQEALAVALKLAER